MPLPTDSAEEYCLDEQEFTQALALGTRVSFPSLVASSGTRGTVAPGNGDDKVSIFVGSNAEKRRARSFSLLLSRGTEETEQDIRAMISHGWEGTLRNIHRANLRCATL